jgi:ubiquinone/menaquinone biosynthesis C-methylase UbiE
LGDAVKKMNEHLKKVASYWDWWSKNFDSNYFERFALYHKVTLDNIRRYVPKDEGATVLDAGGGTGIWSLELARMGYNVVLTDISQQMMKMAKKKVSEQKLDDKIEIRTSDICDMPEFEDNWFAMVLCEGDPISYCGDHLSAIKELVRVVQKGGAVIASVDNRAIALNSLLQKNDREAIQRLLETGNVAWPQKTKGFRHVIHAFTPEELKELYGSNGLSVERIIGKLVIADRSSFYRSKDHKIQKWLYRLESKYNDDAAYYPLAAHLEIVGRKI